MTPLLRLRGLRKRFGEQALFDIPNLVIDAGTAYILTGPNGSGKTTLLRILGGLEQADVDHIEFHGQPVSLNPYPAALRRAVLYVHQQPVLFSTSIAGNIGYGLRTRGLPAEVIRQEVEDAMAWAGVSHLQGQRPETLSGGEKQRVALARAKVMTPELLLLDEPTANLDGAAREQVVTLIPDLLKTGSSVIIATHDPDLITLPGRRLLDLTQGRLQVS